MSRLVKVEFLVSVDDELQIEAYAYHMHFMSQDKTAFPSLSLPKCTHEEEAKIARQLFAHLYFAHNLHEVTRCITKEVVS